MLISIEGGGITDRYALRHCCGGSRCSPRWGFEEEEDVDIRVEVFSKLQGWIYVDFPLSLFFVSSSLKDVYCLLLPLKRNLAQLLCYSPEVSFAEAVSYIITKNAKPIHHVEVLNTRDLYRSRGIYLTEIFNSSHQDKRFKENPRIIFEVHNS